MAKAKEDKKVAGATPTLDPVATPDRVPTEEGFSLTVVLPGADPLKLTFNTKSLRDQAAGNIQSSVKRGAMSKGYEVRAREGSFFFCHVLYVVIEGNRSRKE